MAENIQPRETRDPVAIRSMEDLLDSGEFDWPGRTAHSAEVEALFVRGGMIRESELESYGIRRKEEEREAA